MEEKPKNDETQTERQPFHFRALLENYDYLCALTQHDRFRSLNLCLNIILTLLRKHGVKSLVELQSILGDREKRDEEMEAYNETSGAPEFPG